MTTFLSTLRTLDAAATPGPWMKHKDPRLPNHIGEWTISRIPHQGLSPNGTFFVAHIVSIGADNANDSDLITFLRNHAAAIIGCVEAARGAEEALESAIPYFEEYACGKPHKDLDAGVAALSALATALAALEGK